MVEARWKCTLLTLASLSSASALADPNLLVNGGFEDPTFVDDSLHYVHLTGTQLTGWKSFSSYKGTVLFNHLYNPVSQGLQAVQIEVPGDWISQTFTTVVGASYELSFDMMAYTVSGGPGLGRTPCPCISVLNVSVGPASATFKSSSAGYVTQMLDFTANNSSTTVTFTNPSVPSAWGNYPEIDNVSVVQTTAVPEPLKGRRMPIRGPTLPPWLDVDHRRLTVNLPSGCAISRC
jgi:hypothetical protein